MHQYKKWFFALFVSVALLVALCTALLGALFSSLGSAPYGLGGTYWVLRASGSGVNDEAETYAGQVYTEVLAGSAGFAGSTVVFIPYDSDLAYIQTPSLPHFDDEAIVQEGSAYALMIDDNKLEWYGFTYAVREAAGSQDMWLGSYQNAAFHLSKAPSMVGYYYLGNETMVGDLTSYFEQRGCIVSARQYSTAPGIGIIDRILKRKEGAGGGCS